MRGLGRALCLLFLLAATAAFALSIRLESRIGSVSGAAWQTEGIELSVERGPDGGRLQLSVEKLELSAPFPLLTELQVECEVLHLTEEQASCETGRVQFNLPQGESVSGGLHFTYRLADKALAFELAELNLADGSVTVRGKLAESWDLYLGASRVNAGALAALLRVASDWQKAQGQLTVNARLSGNDTALQEIRVLATSQDLGFSLASGSWAGEKLGMRLEGAWQPRPDGGEFSADVKLSAGQLYIDPLFLELRDRSPVRLHVGGSLRNDRLRLDRLSLQHPEALRTEGWATLRFGEAFAVETAEVRLIDMIFPGAYSTYLEPFLKGTALGELRTQGRAYGRLGITGGVLSSLDLNLDDLDIEDTRDRFGGRGLNGWLAWSRETEPRHSNLRWAGAQLYDLAIGQGSLALESRGNRFDLLGERRIPVLDGALIVERMAGQGLGPGNFSLKFAGRVAPISMERLSAALGWPPLSGTVSGRIPEVRYADRTLAVDGTLLIQIFGGEVAITHLRVVDLFGTVPELFADVDVRAIDLATLTRTFDFGKIEGKLEGKIRDLRLENWQPVRFEARLATPQDDRSRHRISQRAVENLSALGGAGAGAALSRGFIGLFDEFNYKRLGISCRLQDEVCEMGGVAPASDGYYLVEGSGLPRIDVIGYTRRVDWHELLSRLKAAASAEGAAVR